MSTQKKGFDPLSSLFDVPGPGPALPDVEDEPAAAPTPRGAELPDPPHVRASRAPAAAPPPPAPSPQPDAATLAKLIAKAALAKAGTPAPAARAPKKAAAPKPAAGSRVFAAPPPQRAVSVEEALAAARTAEAKKAAEPTQPPAVAAPAEPEAPRGELTDAVAAILREALPGTGAVYVANALLMDDRGVLRALWRAHRARFESAGDLERAVAATAVLRAVGAVPVGKLVAAHAVTDATDYLVWVDLAQGQPLAAFADARAWFGSGG